ncbi:MAG: hypothetical protein WBF90_17440 [Rivularia sp. (in: cyanobacteria)]
MKYIHPSELTKSASSEWSATLILTGCRDVIHNVSLRLGENSPVKIYEKDY